ncbi:MAG: hypothetical protein IPG50_06430 [Myxococcales bacterium]|nr:hypothetical protein [Myxococcales bacterium]
MTTDGESNPALFFLRASAVWAALTLPIARIVAPGLRGNAGDHAVVLWQVVAATTSYGLALLLASLSAVASAQLLRREHPLRGLRGVTIAGVMVTIALVAPAFVRRLPSQPVIVIALVSSIVVLVAATRALSERATRAVGLVFAAFALAALVRLFAWQLAVAAGEQVSSGLYATSRGIATAGVVLEALGQLAVVVWLGTRGGVLGQVTTSAAVVLGFAITWGATLGVHHDAERWQAVLHTALADASGLPAPFALSAAATFLLSATFPLTIAAALSALRGGRDSAPAAVVALLLVSHGSFDAPLRALAAVSAAAAALSMAQGATPSLREPGAAPG